ncbi:MAG: DinB family protein [Ardenticatenaceae bacterium]
MGLKGSIFGVVRNLLFERPAKKRTLGELAANLENDGKKIEQRMAEKGDSERNRSQAIHIIGIERWAQRRLKVALGEPFVLDEHDGYCPPANSSWSQLRADFQSTREASVDLARQLQEANVTLATTVRHNDFGETSTHGWLYYMNFHANQESKRIR